MRRAQTAPRGQVLILTIVFLAALFVATVAALRATQFTRRAVEDDRRDRVVIAIAEAGLARAVTCLTHTIATDCGGSVGAAYVGERDLPLGGGTVTTTVTVIATDRKRVEAVAAIPNAAHPVRTATLREEVALDVTRVGFSYGAQVGNRGITLGNTARIEGNVMSGGSIVGANGVRITGDAIVAAAPPLAAAVDVRTAPVMLAVGRASPVVDIAQPFTLPSSGQLQSVTLFLRKVGNPSDATIRILTHDDDAGTPSTTEVTHATLRASSVTATSAWVTVPFTQPMLAGRTTYWAALDASARANDYWEVGFDPATASALVNEDMNQRRWSAANGTIAHQVWTGGVDTRLDTVAVGGEARAHAIARSTVDRNAQAQQFSETVVGGSILAGTVSRTTVGGNATAETITNSTIGGNVWCETISGSTVGGQRNCPVPVDPPPDPTPVEFPITRAQIDDWLADAQAGGTMAGPVEPTGGSTVRLGPITIAGDLTVANNQTIIVTGTIAVSGSITIGNNTDIVLDPAYGSNSGMIIASGPIHIENNGVLRGSEQAGSYLLFLSTATGGGHHDSAIDLHNGASGAIFVAPYGTVNLHNLVTISQLTADGITMSNGAILKYDRGFADIRFTSGPTVGWVPIPGTWTRVP